MTKETEEHQEHNVLDATLIADYRVIKKSGGIMGNCEFNFKIGCQVMLLLNIFTVKRIVVIVVLKLTVKFYNIV